MNLRQAARWLVLLCASVLLLSRSAVGAAVEVVPADNPYAPAYAAIARLSAADRDALPDEKPLSAGAAPVIAEVVKSLGAGRRAESVNWGLDYGAGWSMPFRYVVGVQSITRLAFASVEPDAAGGQVGDRALDVLAFGRQLGRDNLLITLLVERAVEQQAVAYVRKNLARLTPAEAGRLLDGLDTLPRGSDLAGALKRESEMVARPDRLRSLLSAEETKEQGAEFERMMELACVQIADVYREAGEYPERFNDDEAFKQRMQALVPAARGPVGMLPRIILKGAVGG
jgi:hypothetical protein